MSIKKASGELTGREFHWGLLAGLAGSAIGDIFSTNAANNAQQSAEQNANQQTQNAINQQENYINQQQGAQRAAIGSAASAGNPSLNALGLLQKPNAAAYQPPPATGATFGGGNVGAQPLYSGVLAPQQQRPQQPPGGVLAPQQQQMQPGAQRQAMPVARMPGQ